MSAWGKESHCGAAQRASVDNEKSGPRTVRSYIVRLYPNQAKAEEHRYATWWFQRLTMEYARALYWLPDRTNLCTAGQGKIGNHALRTAQGRVTNTGVNMNLLNEKYRKLLTWLKISLDDFLPELPNRASAETTVAVIAALNKKGYCISFYQDRPIRVIVHTYPLGVNVGEGSDLITAAIAAMERS